MVSFTVNYKKLLITSWPRWSKVHIFGNGMMLIENSMLFLSGRSRWRHKEIWNKYNNLTQIVSGVSRRPVKRGDKETLETELTETLNSITRYPLNCENSPVLLHGEQCKAKGNDEFNTTGQNREPGVTLRRRTKKETAMHVHLKWVDRWQWFRLQNEFSFFPL